MSQLNSVGHILFTVHHSEKEPTQKEIIQGMLDRVQTMMRDMSDSDFL